MVRLIFVFAAIAIIGGCADQKEADAQCCDQVQTRCKTRVVKTVQRTDWCATHKMRKAERRARRAARNCCPAPASAPVCCPAPAPACAPAPVCVVQHQPCPPKPCCCVCACVVCCCHDGGEPTPVEPPIIIDPPVEPPVEKPAG